MADKVNPYSHPCGPDCECDGRKAMVRMNRQIDLLIWLMFFVIALLAYWRFA